MASYVVGKLFVVAHHHHCSSSKSLKARKIFLSFFFLTDWVGCGGWVVVQKNQSSSCLNVTVINPNLKEILFYESVF